MGSNRIRKAVSVTLESETLDYLDELAKEDGTNRSRMIDVLAADEYKRRNCHLPSVREAWENSSSGKLAKNRVRYAAAARVIVDDVEESLLANAESAALKMWAAGPGAVELDDEETKALKWLGAFVRRSPPLPGSEVSVALASLDLSISAQRLSDKVANLS